MNEGGIYFKIYKDGNRQNPFIEAEIKIKNLEEFKEKLSKIIQEHSITSALSKSCARRGSHELYQF